MGRYSAIISRSSGGIVVNPAAGSTSDSDGDSGTAERCEISEGPEVLPESASLESTNFAIRRALWGAHG